MAAEVVERILSNMKRKTKEITAPAREVAQKSQSQPVQLPRKVVIVSMTGACGMGPRYAGRTSV
jgi:hypothetical protein